MYPPAEKKCATFEKAPRASAFGSHCAPLAARDTPGATYAAEEEAVLQDWPGVALQWEPTGGCRGWTAQGVALSLSADADVMPLRQIITLPTPGANYTRGITRYAQGSDLFFDQRGVGFINSAAFWGVGLEGNSCG